LLPSLNRKKKDEAVKAQGQSQLLELAEQLSQPELCFEERLGIVARLRELLGVVNEHAPPELFA